MSMGLQNISCTLKKRSNILDLDIDIALFPYDMNPSTIGNLREAYKWFSLAFKLSSYITNFEREFFAQRSVRQQESRKVSWSSERFPHDEGCTEVTITLVAILYEMNQEVLYLCYFVIVQNLF